MSGRVSGVLVAAFTLPAVTAALALEPGSDPSGRFQFGLVVGLLSLAVVALVRAKVRHDPVPLAAVAVLAALVPCAVLVGGLWVALGTSEAAGDWMTAIAFGGLGLAAVTAAGALAAPRRRRVAKVLCCGVVLSVVPAGALAAYASTAEGRHADHVKTFPAAGPGRAWNEAELRQSLIFEYELAVRSWDSPGLTCDELPDVFDDWSDGEVRQETDALVDDEECGLTAETAWRGTRAALTADGELVVGAWSPTADLFVF